MGESHNRCYKLIMFFLQTRMQSLQPNPNARYRGIAHALKTIARTEGKTAVIRGVNVVAVGAGPAHSLYFASYELARKAMGNVRSSSGQNNPVANGMYCKISQLKIGYFNVRRQTFMLRPLLRR